MVWGVIAAAAFGTGMFLWGQLSIRHTEKLRMEREYLFGFRDGFESAERLDDDLTIIYGGNS
jgi:hypothetical protein